MCSKSHIKYFSEKVSEQIWNSMIKPSVNFNEYDYSSRDFIAKN